MLTLDSLSDMCLIMKPLLLKDWTRKASWSLIPLGSLLSPMQDSVVEAGMMLIIGCVGSLEGNRIGIQIHSLLGLILTLHQSFALEESVFTSHLIKAKESPTSGLLLLLHRLLLMYLGMQLLQSLLVARHYSGLVSSQQCKLWCQRTYVEMLLLLLGFN